MRQLVQVVQTALQGQASPVEPGLANLQVFGRRQTLQAVDSPLQALLQAANPAQASAAPFVASAAPLLALTDELAPAAAADPVQATALLQSTAPARNENPPQPESSQQQGPREPVNPPQPESSQQQGPRESAREQPPSAAAAVSGGGGVEASLQALALQHYGADLETLQGDKDPASSKPGKGGRGKGKVKATCQKSTPKNDGPPLRRPAAAKKRPAAPPPGKTLTVQECLKLRPSGCSKCRQRPGCCPSCWRGRGIVVI